MYHSIVFTEVNSEFPSLKLTSKHLNPTTKVSNFLLENGGIMIIVYGKAMPMEFRNLN